MEIIKPMKFFVIAGEASGDLHGSNLIREIRNIDSSAQFRCYGGDLMKSEGAEIVKHIGDLDFMGFWEIFINLRTILGYIKECKRDILEWKPDAIILIDYPGFNLRIAEFARKNNIPVFFYISPQIWAWKQRRIHKIKRNVNRLFVILPFEKEFYARFGYEVDFVGHPLLDAMSTLQSCDNETFRVQNQLSTKPIIALLPGSRKQEITRILPEMINVIPEFNNEFQFVIAGATSVSIDFYRKIIGSNNIQVIFEQTYNLLSQSEAALITSGTATLEAALLDVPQVVCYKANPVSYFIAKKLVRLKYISLVNLILNREVVKELIQKEMNAVNVTFHLRNLISDTKKREQILEDYVELKRKLGGKGASKVTAELILKHLAEN